MPLSPEQKQTVAAWAAAGDTLAAIQKKLSEQFKISMTYMEVRFLVDDLGLELKNPAAPKPEATSDLTKARPAQPASPDSKGGLFDKLKKAVGAGKEEEAETPGVMDAEEGDLPPGAEEDALPADLAGGGRVKVEVDRIVRPGAVMSGTVTFSDGVAAKWAMDQHGRLMLDSSRKGYQPSAADVQTFQRELSQQLQRHGY